MKLCRWTVPWLISSCGNIAVVSPLIWPAFPTTKCDVSIIERQLDQSVPCRLSGWSTRTFCPTILFLLLLLFSLLQRWCLEFDVIERCNTPGAPALCFQACWCWLQDSSRIVDASEVLFSNGNLNRDGINWRRSRTPPQHQRNGRHDGSAPQLSLFLYWLFVSLQRSIALFFLFFSVI